MRTSAAAAFIGLLIAGPAGAAEPLSAIDWLSDSIAAPVAPSPADLPRSAAIPEVEIRPLGAQLPDGVGLLPAAAAGLSRDLWRGSSSADLARSLTSEPRDLVPTLQGLLKRVLLAELDPPRDADERGVLLIARIDRLLVLGALDEASALLDLAGTMSPELFKRRFDVALLTGDEQRACQDLKTDPTISPTYPARIFCLARTGDWHTAAVTHETANALGLLSDQEDDLLARFLHPEIAEQSDPLLPPIRPTPLVFRLYDSIGEPLSSIGLPVAFAHADLSENVGWKGRLEAAERLARAGAIDPNLLLGLYTERRPSASGGVWERAGAAQTLDRAISDGSPEDISDALLAAWKEFRAAGLALPFAELYAPRLIPSALAPEARSLAFRLSLLTGDFQLAALRHRPDTPVERFLQAVALGRADETPAPDAVSLAIREGFAAAGVPDRARMGEDAGRRGEALLGAMALFGSGALGNHNDLRDAIALLRFLGFETAARRAALELLILSEGV